MVRLMVDPDGDAAEVSGHSSGKICHSHEQCLTEPVGDLQERGAERVEAKAAGHQSAKVGGSAVRNIGGETEQEEEVCLWVEG